MQTLIAGIRATSVTRVPRPIRTHKIEPRLGGDKVQEILERYRSGDPVAAIAESFGVSLSSLQRMVKRHGLEMRDQPLTPQVVAEAAALYEAGLSVQRVADRLGVPKSTLLRALKAIGIQVRAPKR